MTARARALVEQRLDRAHPLAVVGLDGVDHGLAAGQHRGHVRRRLGMPGGPVAAPGVVVEHQLAHHPGGGHRVQEVGDAAAQPRHHDVAQRGVDHALELVRGALSGRGRGPEGHGQDPAHGAHLGLVTARAAVLHGQGHQRQRAAVHPGQVRGLGAALQQRLHVRLDEIRDRRAVVLLGAGVEHGHALDLRGMLLERAEVSIEQVLPLGRHHVGEALGDHLGQHLLAGLGAARAVELQRDHAPQRVLLRVARLVAVRLVLDRPVHAAVRGLVALARGQHRGHVGRQLLARGHGRLGREHLDAALVEDLHLHLGQALDLMLLVQALLELLDQGLDVDARAPEHRVLDRADEQAGDVRGRVLALLAQVAELALAVGPGLEQQQAADHQADAQEHLDGHAPLEKPPDGHGRGRTIDVYRRETNLAGQGALRARDLRALASRRP